MHNAKCYAAHMGGPWSIDPLYAGEAMQFIRNGLWKPREDFDQPSLRHPIWQPSAATPSRRRDSQSSAKAYYQNVNGTAIISIEGPMMKFWSKYGGANTIFIRQQIRLAVEDPYVSSILLLIDSPGGTVAGTQMLADEVRDADKKKPVYAQIEDLGCSAAYWVASQARRIFAENDTATIGSIGTVLVLYDESKAADLAGIKVHVISAGAYKGAGAPGSEITPEHAKYFQDRVDSLNASFVKGIQARRSITDYKQVLSGKAFVAKKAKALGLIDRIQSIDATLDQIWNNSATSNTADARAMLSEMESYNNRIGSYFDDE